MTSTTTKLNSKEVHFAIKRGLTSNELAVKFGMTVEELYTVIREKMSAGAKELIRDLQKNDRRRKKSEEVNTITEMLTVETETEVTEVTEEVAEESEDDLTRLHNDEAQLSAELIDLEKDHVQMAQRRHEILGIAKESNKRLVKIQQALLEEEGKIESLLTEYEELAIKMTSNTQERRCYEELLDEVRSEIEKLTKVSVSLKSDGSLEASKPEILDVISSEDEALELTTVMAIPEAEDFTLRQLKGVSKARILQRMDAEVIYDDVFNIFF